MKKNIFKFIALLILSTMLFQYASVEASISNDYTALTHTNQLTNENPGDTTRVSIASDGSEGNDHSMYTTISADGRYVSFASDTNNLVPGDTNFNRDIFVHDREIGETTRVSVASDGTQGNDHSMYTTISADGRYVAFASDASNLVPGDTNSNRDIFVHDRNIGETTRVSIASDGTQGNDGSYYPSLSADGRFVAFSSSASNLVEGDTNFHVDVFMHNLETGETIRVSVASDGTQGNDGSSYASLSGDGKYVTFRSDASNLVVGDTNSSPDIFVHNLNSGVTTNLSVASDGTQGNNSSFNPTISANGRYVAFCSGASNLVPGDENGSWDTFVRDLETDETTIVSVASDGSQGDDDSYTNYVASISAEGRYVTFRSAASNLASGDTNLYSDVFLHDRETGETIRVSIASDGSQGNDKSGYPSISADGRFVAFASSASNLVSGDMNGVTDIFVHHSSLEETVTISGRVVDQNNSGIEGIEISTDTGHYVTSDMNGNYTMVLSYGVHNLLPNKDGYTFSPAIRTINVTFDMTNVDFVASVLSPPEDCEVPFFYQKDIRWKDHPLRTSGGCSPYCSTIGACGCALTSIAMVFSHYGANTTPKVLSDCLGTSACPMSWSLAGSSCSSGQASFVLYDNNFSWSKLDSQINQFNRPVILGLYVKDDPSLTHFVVVTNGQGTNPANYTIHDPDRPGGADMKLNALTPDYHLFGLRVYDGRSVCGQTQSNLTTTNIYKQSNYFDPLLQYNSQTECAFHQTDSLASEHSDLFGLPTSNSLVRGKALIYRITSLDMIVQLIAESDAGNIAEMKIWTDEINNPEWQQFSTLITLPRSQNVYALFRDEYGNESDQLTDSIIPEYPLTLDTRNYIFLPLLLK